MKDIKHIAGLKSCLISLSITAILIFLGTGCIVKERLPSSDDDPNSTLPGLICTDDNQPVYGTNGVSYNNRCEAGDIAIAYTGSCGTALFESRDSCVDLGLLGEQSYVYLFVYYQDSGELREDDLHTRVVIEIGLVPFSLGEGWDELLNLVQLRSVKTAFNLEDGSIYPVSNHLGPSVMFEPTKITYAESRVIQDYIVGEVQTVALINMRGQDCELRATLIAEGI